MSVGDAQEPRAASAGPTHDVSGTAHSQSEICGLARRRGEVEGMGVPTAHRRVLRKSGCSGGLRTQQPVTVAGVRVVPDTSQHATHTQRHYHSGSRWRRLTWIMMCPQSRAFGPQLRKFLGRELINIPRITVF